MPTPECLQAQIDALHAQHGDAEKRIRELERVRSEANGALWAFAKVGAATTIAFGVIGWIAVNGIPEALRHIAK